MKKLLAACLCLGLTLNLSGCAIGDLIDKFTDTQTKEESVNSAPKQRVYMDEVKGTLVDFTGNTITLAAGEETYHFDISDATLECQEGMITGDEISVIYEGKLEDFSTDTSSVKALKVVSNYHKQQKQKEYTATGTMQSITTNTITLLDPSGVRITYPATGCEEYFSGGIRKDVPLFIHYYGTLDEAPGSSSDSINASHLKLISVSDADPFAAPKAVKIAKEETARAQMQTTLQSIDLNTLTVLLSDQTTTLTLDISQVPCYFQGGAVPGTPLTVTYSGTFNGVSTEGITIEDIQTKRSKKKVTESVISGVIIAGTANTITIRTGDNAVVTCNTELAENTSTSGMEIGAEVKITFHPTENKTSNIYTALKIEDRY